MTSYLFLQYRRIFIRTLVFVLVNCFVFISGRVDIIKPFHPFYVKAGSTLTILCESQTKTTLEWVRQSPLTAWHDETIKATKETDFVIQSFEEKPSGLTRSTLIKKNVSLEDRGTYICKEPLGSYLVWVTVVHIDVGPIRLSDDNSSLILSCSISGFDSNSPSVDYDWFYNGHIVPHPHDVMISAASSVLHPAPHLVQSERYKVAINNGNLTLYIANASQSDKGLYNCSFTLSTNLGPITFNESISVDELSLPEKNDATRSLLISSNFLVTILFSISLFSMNFQR